MATLTCSNTGCYKMTSDSLLDEESNQVICSECGKPIENISDFTKRSMRGMGKVVKTIGKAAFCVTCKKCERRGQPSIEDNKAVCFNCKEPLALTRQFENTFREFLKNKNG